MTSKHTVTGKIESASISKYIFVLSIKRPKTWNSTSKDLEKMKDKNVVVTMEVLEEDD